MELKDFQNMYWWYGVADGEAGTSIEEKKTLFKLFLSLSHEDRQTIYHENREDFDDIISQLKEDIKEYMK